MAEENYISNEIIGFYRDKNMKFAIEDLMNNKMNPKHYKILFKLIPLNKENKAIKEEVMLHYLDVVEAKRICRFILGDKIHLFDTFETIQNNKIPAYKDLKGGLVEGELQSRILTLYEQQGAYIVQLTTHKGKQTEQGAVSPISGPIKRKYIKLTRREMEQLAIELLDFIIMKETTQFRYYHTKTTANNKNREQQQNEGGFSWGA